MAFKGLFTVQISKPTPKAVGGFLPKAKELDKMFEWVRDSIEPQIAAGALTGLDINIAYSKMVLSQWYVGNGPSGLVFGNNTCCHGAGVNVTTYRSYWMETRPAYSPEDFNARYGHYPKIFVTEKGKTYEVHTMRGPSKDGLGRAGGATGWDSTRDMFAFALASFRHNFQALLGAFASRPSLPCTEAWHLPNLINSNYVQDIESKYGCKIVEPPVAVPPASYTYSFTLPTPMAALAVGTNCPKDTNAYIEFWGSDKKDLVEPFAVTFPQGENETIITLRATPPALIQSGYFNINPVDGEMTVSYVKVLFPPL